MNLLKAFENVWQKSVKWSKNKKWKIMSADDGGSLILLSMGVWVFYLTDKIL